MIKQEIIDFLQEEYEDILSQHWHKVLQVRELKETNRNNSPLRLQSINRREKELLKILKKKEAIELLYEDYITIPQWYKDITKKHNIA